MDELLSRVMPHSLEAEQAVLGAMFLDAQRIPDVIKLVKRADFYLEANRNIYETILAMSVQSKAIDPVTVLEQMRKDGVAGEGTARYIAELVTLRPTAANVMEYVSIVRDKSLLRQVAETSGEITELVHTGGGTADAVLEAAEQKIYAIRQGRTTGGLVPVSTVLQEAYDKVSAAAKRDEEIPGVTTGLHDLDRIIMGLNKSDLIFIASRPGMGKTSIALNVTLSAAKASGKSVAFFSLEMSREQLALRLLAGESHVNTKKLQTGRLTQDDWRRFASAAAEISRTKILIDDNSMSTVSDMQAQCRRVNDLGLVVIDYLQLMTSAGVGQGAANQNRTQIVSEISRFLKIMAKELNVPVVCLSQLNRASADRKDKRPQLSDLRESGSIEQDADIVLGLYREDYYAQEAENPNEAECIVMKNRHGETGSVKLLWLPEYTTYTTLERRREDPGY
ncbi:MAG: replicative DNA helicase [Oscillospiraceae bacterium]|nr:replicative DNA helicase [Oscillospiraceae bacterium]